MLPPPSRRSGVVEAGIVSCGYLVVVDDRCPIVVVPDLDAEPIGPSAAVDASVDRGEHEPIVAGAVDRSRALVLRTRAAITSHSYAVDSKFIPAAWNWNSVLPSGVLCPFLYLETNPNVALPVSVESGRYAPPGELIHPPPVTKPPFGS